MATTIYRRGSRGDAVKTIQLALKLAGYQVPMDGEFGNKTEAAVRSFQQSRYIGCDGVVGPVTMAKLQEVLDVGCKQTTDDGLTVTNGYIYEHVTRCAKRKIQYVAIHYTAGRTSRVGQAMQNRNVFLQRKASADFVVDDETIVQVNPDLRNFYCWSVGDKKNPWTGGARLYGTATNRNTVSIEICSTLKDGTSVTMPNHEGWTLSPQAVDNARRVVRHLMRQYGIPKDNVILHYDVSGKLCPGVPGWNEGPLYTASGKETGKKSGNGEWKRFLDSL